MFQTLESGIKAEFLKIEFATKVYIQLYHISLG